MARQENGFIRTVKDGLSYISEIISLRLFDQMIDATQIIMDNVEERVEDIQKNILRKISAFMVIGFGALFLIFALLFFLKEFFNLSNSASFLFISVILFAIGLILQLRGSTK